MNKIRFHSSKKQRNKKMGIFKSEIRLRNPLHPNLDTIQVKALVDTGSVFLCLPESLVMQLQLPELEKRQVTLANGKSEWASYVGPVEVFFENRRCFVGAMVLGDEPLLGSIPMEDMDLIVDPQRRQLLVNPAHPNFAGAYVKSVLLPLSAA